MDLTLFNILVNQRATLETQVLVAGALVKRADTIGLAANLKAKAADSKKNIEASLADLNAIWAEYVEPNL